jgi:hypothetical protein
MLYFSPKLQLITCNGDFWLWSLGKPRYHLNIIIMLELSDGLYIGLDESPTGFKYAPIFAKNCFCCCFVFLSTTITVGLSERPSSSLARFS